MKFNDLFFQAVVNLASFLIIIGFAFAVGAVVPVVLEPLTAVAGLATYLKFSYEASVSLDWCIERQSLGASDA